MQTIKSIFISLYVTFLLCSFVFLLSAIIGSKFEEIYYIGALVATMGPIIYFVYIYAKSPKSVTILSIIISSSTAAMFLVTLGQRVTEITDSIIPFVLALTSLLGWVLYLIWYGKLNKANLKDQDIHINQLDFQHSNGSLFTPSKDYNYHMYIFYRGNWCPFCVRQIKEMAIAYDKFEERKVEINFVSSAQDKQTQKLIKEYDLKMNFLFDPDLTNASKLKLDNRNSLPLGFQLLNFKSDNLRPAVILTDKNFEVIAVHETDDYKKRPEPEFFIRIVDEHINPTK